MYRFSVEFRDIHPGYPCCRAASKVFLGPDSSELRNPVRWTTGHVWCLSVIAGKSLV
jgi:hypothetical protein